MNKNIIKKIHTIIQKFEASKIFKNFYTNYICLICTFMLRWWQLFD